ncbi:energy-coupling factor transporter ATPase [Mycoplasma crocodyli]|uniref:Energy-coupling factor transporter ATP-binding protein EcfA2 n=1 Tax=Mycoplasma crocodyli (strain ATCC 51981 / MP145) TaxID=512564 RepID=D5E691_MYCCM|nr:energy-coupling factor transporter ATPase [Mycoplasma crocodyli]ADE19399.1 cobalt ABC transporter, ATP-binding protein CbiO 2 [Mycoplasma crocodyli MP145]
MKIIVRELSHIFNKKTPMVFKALNNVNVTIEQGEYIGIIGQTGSGKTTFIEHLNALLLPEDGTIEWIFRNEKTNKKTKEVEVYLDKITVKKSRKKKVKNVKDIRKRVGTVFQFAEYQLFKATIEEDIMFGPMSFGVTKAEAKERAKKYIEIVGLDESYLERSPFALSGGQKRRVALAGILAMELDFLVVDEPTAGLDPVGVVEILEIFKKLHDMGKTVINVTHDLDNILAYSKRVLLFKDGQIIKDGETYPILKDTKFLLDNNLQPPKLLHFVSKLEEKGLEVPKVINIQELADFLNQWREGK